MNSTQKLNSILEKRWIIHLIFLSMTLVLFLPFLINGELITWNDSQFHLTRIYEMIKQQQNGQFFPDIVQYSGIQNWGYGLNIFYPPYALMPLIFLWRLLDNPVLAFILFDIFIVYFALVMNYTFFKKASKNTVQAFLFSTTYILTASAGTGTFNIPLVRLALITQFTSNIVFLFAPVVLISFYKIIFQKDKSFWRSAAAFSAISVMLSVPATLGLIIVIFGMFIVGIFLKKITPKNLTVLTGTAVATLFLSAIFVLPFLEQRLGSPWASLPLRNQIWGMSFFENVIRKIFDFSDILSLLLIVILVLLFLHKKLDKRYKQLAFGYLATLLFLHSTIFPWYLIQDALAGTLQMTYRWNFIPQLIGSVFVARGMVDLAQEKAKIIPILSSATLAFAILGMYGNTLSKYFPVTPADQDTIEPKAGQTTKAFEPTKENLILNLFYRINSENVHVILDSNFASRKELGLNQNDPMFSSLAFNDYRREGQYKDHQKVYANSLVKFEGQLHENMTSAQGEDFFIHNLPTTIETVQAPITYLKGFKAFDATGNPLNSYMNKDGFLEIAPNGSETVKITYEKTFLHKASILISTISWIILLLGILLHKLTKGGKRRAKTINRHTSLQRRRNAGALR